MLLLTLHTGIEGRWMRNPGDGVASLALTGALQEYYDKRKAAPNWSGLGA